MYGKKVIKYKSEINRHPEKTKTDNWRNIEIDKKQAGIKQSRQRNKIQIT